MKGLCFCVVLPLAVCTVLAGGFPFSHWGVIDTPCAEILQHSQIAFGGCFTAYSYDNADSTTESDFAIGGYLEGGLFDMGQIGITYLGAGGISGTARFLAMRETFTRPGIAIGCENITGEKNYEFWKDENDSLYSYGESQNFSAYFVLSKNFKELTGIPMSWNLGYGIGRFKQAKDNKSDGFDNPFPGIFSSFTFYPGTSTTLAVEWDGRDLNIGGNYRLNRTVEFCGAVSEVEQLFRPGDEIDKTDVMQNIKFTIGVEFLIGPFFNRTTLEPTERLVIEHDVEALRALEEARSRAKQEIQELEDYMQ